MIGYRTSKKKRTILELQDLYLRLKERHENKRKWFTENIYDRVVNEIPEVDGKKIIFYKDVDIIYSIEYSTYNEYKTWGYSTNRFNLDNRNDRLFFLSDDLIEKRFELGELQNRFRNHDRYFHTYVWELLEKKINEQLEDRFKNKTCEKVFKLKIGNKDYFISCKDSYSYYYKKFNINEVGSEEVVLV